MPNLPRLFRPKSLGPRKDAERKRQRDLRERRGPRLEDKAWWQRQRKWFVREHRLCVCCRANGVISPTELVDHIVPHNNEDGELFRDPGNWQPLCNLCHEQIKKPLENSYHRGKASADDLRLDRFFPEHFGGS